MKTLARFRPSPALAVATLALVISLGGTAAAVTLIDGATIKRNTVTGKQVDESTLAKVPAATAADRLTPLKPGESLSGPFAAGSVSDQGTGGNLAAAFAFSRPIPGGIAEANVIEVRPGFPNDHCPGVGQADPGYLCVYVGEYDAIDLGIAYASDPWLQVNGRQIGVQMLWATNDLQPYVLGSWTVTAPLV